MLLKNTMAALLQGLTLLWLGLSCEATSLGMTVHIEPQEATGGSMVRAHFSAIAFNPCPSFSGVCAAGEDCVVHVTSRVFSGTKPDPGWCVRQWYKTVPSNFAGTVSLGSNTQIYISMNAGPTIRDNTGKLNQPPYVALPPPLRARENCPLHYKLSVRDLDGDRVRCRIADGTQGECRDCAPHSFIELDENKCTVTFTGNAAAGQYFIFLMVEDVIPSSQMSQATNNQPLSAVPVHLSLTVEAASGKCSDEPLALPGTPVRNSLRNILPFQQDQFAASFISQTQSILEIAVVGPPELFRVGFTTGPMIGITMAWTRQDNMLPRLLPICFAANTERLQSEPRCVWLFQRRVMAPPTGTELTCGNSQMNLLLPVTSLTDVNLDELQLNNPNCPVTHNNTYLTAQISFNGCGTEIVQTDTELIYLNLLQSVNPNSVITRKPTLMLPLACRLPTALATGPQYQIGIPTELETFGEARIMIMVTIPDLSTRRQREVGSNIGTPVGSMHQALDITVMFQSAAERAELMVSNCIESDTEDFASFRPLVERGCLNSSRSVQILSSAFNHTTYRILTSEEDNQRQVLYLRCSVNLCLTTLPSATCPDLCNSTLNTAVLVNTLLSRTVIVNSGPISLVVTTPGPATTASDSNCTCSHAPEQTSIMATGVILTTISILLQKFYFY